MLVSTCQGLSMIWPRRRMWGSYKKEKDLTEWKCCILSTLKFISLLVSFSHYSVCGLFDKWNSWIFREQILQIKHAFNSWDRSYLIWIECVLKLMLESTSRIVFGATMLTHGSAWVCDIWFLSKRRKYTSSLAAISWYTEQKFSFSYSEESEECIWV